MQGCGIVAENDVEFGKVLVAESVADRGDLPSVRVEPEKVTHLDESQRTELLRLLNGYADCFSDKPGLCDVIMHRIVTTPDFVPKQIRPYRVPEVFRLKVNRKVRELLDPGLIRLSDSSIANPVVRLSLIHI